MPPAEAAFMIFQSNESLCHPLWAISMSWDRDAACALNSLTWEGLAHLESVDDSTLTDFVHTFFCGDDPGYDSPGKLLAFGVDPTLPTEH